MMVLALLLPCCSVPVAGSIEHLANAVESHCGWFQGDGSPYAPEAECHVLVAQGSAGLTLGDADPCDVAPATELRVEAGEPHAEWHKFEASYTVLIEPCHN